MRSLLKHKFSQTPSPTIFMGFSVMPDHKYWMQGIYKIIVKSEVCTFCQAVFLPNLAYEARFLEISASSDDLPLLLWDRKDHPR